MDLESYLRSLKGSAGQADGLILTRISDSGTRATRPAIDVLSLWTPLKPMLIETRRPGGRAIRRTLRSGDICLYPPMIELDVRLAAADMIVADAATTVVIATAKAMNFKSAADLEFRLVHRAHDTLLSSLAVELCNEQEQGAPSGGRYAELLAALFLSCTVKRYAARPTEAFPWGITGSEGRIHRALAFIDKRLTRNLEVSDVARHVGVSPTHLRAVFKSATGETIGAYVRRRRLERARALLSRTTLSVADVAEKVGYASTPQFTHAFKAAFVVPPGTYRKSLRR